MAKATEAEEPKEKKKCGIIMPISAHPDYTADHWNNVLSIINEAVGGTEFEPDLVSNDEAIGLIHERIVTNIYHNEMIVCDVSSRNPNVMFELGMRLAFDKPVIIIKDEKTAFTFDTGVIEHLSYPSSLRFGDIVNFKKDLIKKIEATYRKSTQQDYSPFLKSFGKTIVPAHIGSETVTETKFLVEQMFRLREDMQRLRGDIKSKNIYSFDDADEDSTLRSQIRKTLADVSKKHGLASREELEKLAFQRLVLLYPNLPIDTLKKAIEHTMLSDLKV